MCCLYLPMTLPTVICTLDGGGEDRIIRLAIVVAV